MIRSSQAHPVSWSSVLVLALGLLSAACAVPPNVPSASPADMNMNSTSLDRIDSMVEESIAATEIPGCVVTIVHRGHKVFQRAYGHRQLQPTKERMAIDTVFDMASITKPVATATSIMILMERGLIRVQDKYGMHVPEFNNAAKDSITIFQMLTHQAGFVPDTPISEYKNRSEIWPLLYATRLRNPPGTKFVYSDVGFQFLGELVKKKSQLTLNEFAQKNIFQPLGMAETGFLPAEPLRARAATTEQREGRWMQGEVHDPRSYAMGGIAGHAGLFSTANDLARYALMMLGNGRYGEARILSPATVEFMTRGFDVAREKRGLGWDKQSRYSSNRGETMSPHAFGHGGFTGTAMWIDPTHDVAVIFLSNRVHPDGKGSANRLAGRIATIAVSSIGNRDSLINDLSNNAAAHDEVLTGIDVLQRDGFQQLAGSRVGLITNHTGRSRNGQRTIDLIHEAKNVDLVSIFSPEHGIEGKRDDNKIGDAKDEVTGLPIYSLYGETRTPSPGSLSHIDTLIFDIQDIGTRFYTYISTMGNAMQAAADHGKKFVVLDRPNPLGAELVDGPVLDEGKQSFVGWHTIPVQHGMTVGELAMMFRREKDIPVDLEIVRSKGWQRNQAWNQTGLVWINPSPNMRSLTEAFLYPGVGLLETTNLSVGRGTDRPFEIVGAPWIKAREFAHALNRRSIPGVCFVPRQFVPASSKFAGETCGGVDIEVTNRSAVRPIQLGITMATVLWQLYPEKWQAAKMERLLCDDSVRQAIIAGKQPQEIESSFQAELQQFKERRKAFLLYD